MQSLRSRLIALIALFGIATLATGALRIDLLYQSASMQAGGAEPQVARARGEARMTVLGTAMMEAREVNRVTRE